MGTTILQAAIAAAPTCEAKTRMFDTARDGVPYCRVRVALQSLIDASGNRRYFCHAPGHRGLVVRSFGESARAELERGTATFDAPGCYFCGRTAPILDGLYTAVDFGGDLGIQHVCDDCRERGDEEPELDFDNREGQPEFNGAFR